MSLPTAIQINSKECMAYHGCICKRKDCPEPHECEEMNT